MAGCVGYPRDPIGCIRSATMFYVMPVATNVKTMIYMGLCATLGCSSGSSRLCKSWGHLLATLPSDGGDYTSLSQNDVNFANHCVSAANLSVV
eukprot:6176124-Pleurochrysis_carterae.AAC.1